MGGDRGVVGRSILLNGESYTVIGVLPGASEFDNFAARRSFTAGDFDNPDWPCRSPNLIRL